MNPLFYKVYAVFISLSLAILYIGMLYLANYIFYTSYPANLERDTRIIIKRRIWITIIYVSTMMFVVYSLEHRVMIPFSLWTPYHIRSDLSLIIPMLMVLILYCGPIYWYFEKRRIRNRKKRVKYVARSVVLDLHGANIGFLRRIGRFIVNKRIAKKIRKYINIFVLRDVIVAPIAEELIFRGICVPLCMNSGWNQFFAIVIPAFLFSVSHFNHFIWAKLSSTDRDVVLESVLFTMLYTFVFGCIFGLFFDRFGTIIAPISAHMTCNWFGVPDIDDRMSKFTWRLYMLGLVLFIAGLCYLTFYL